MLWIAPLDKAAGDATLGKRLGDAADQFHANSGFKSKEYFAPVLGTSSCVKKLNPPLD